MLAALSLADDYGTYEEMEEPPGEHLFPDPSLDHDPLCEGPPGLQKPPGSIPDFMPSAQRALYLRIQHKQQEEEERVRRLAESSKQERENEEGKWQGAGSFLHSSAIGNAPGQPEPGPTWLRRWPAPSWGPLA